MKVFISWSGESSRRCAEVLREWLPGVLQAVRPYFSPEDVAKGSRWGTEIAKELEASSIGLLVLTGENLEAPWLVFEAGALSKSLGSSRVCPILFDHLEPTDLKGPLIQFQAVRFQVDDMRRLVAMINKELGEAALPSDTFDAVFGMWWPTLLANIEGVFRAGSRRGSERRSDRDLLEETLSLVRGMSRGDVRDNQFHEDMIGPAELVSGPFEDFDRSLAKFIRSLRASGYDFKASSLPNDLLRVVKQMTLHRLMVRTYSSLLEGTGSSSLDVGTLIAIGSQNDDREPQSSVGPVSSRLKP